VSSGAAQRPPDAVDAGEPPGHVEASGLDPKSCALVRLGALVALDAGCVSYQWGVQWALAAGATADEIVGTLMAVAPLPESPALSPQHPSSGWRSATMSMRRLRAGTGTPAETPSRHACQRFARNNASLCQTQHYAASVRHSF